MDLNSKIYIAGHRGMAGSAIHRLLSAKGFTNIITRTSKELDLRDQKSVNDFFYREKPEYVFLAAARVGGIHANNTFRGDFLYDNLMIEANVINAAAKEKCKKLLFLGSSCIYPKLAPQPLKEEYLLTGPLEYTNEPYAIAKIAGVKLCEAYRDQYNCNFISVMPTNLYGIGDNYDLGNSHVLPAILRKMHEAKQNRSADMMVWGTGTPKREFLYADDLAEACIFLMAEYNDSKPINVGTGQDLSIIELADLIKKIVGFEGKIVYDSSKPDGTPRKLMDVTKLNNLGWKFKTPLEEGIKLAYQDFLNKHVN